MIALTPTTFPYDWEPLDSAPMQDHLRDLLEAWEGTRYVPGCQLLGKGVDCVRFVCAIVDDLAGINTSIKALPQDASFHRPERARAAVRALLRNYAPVEAVELGSPARPGDVIVVGSGRAGPGHAMLVGTEKNTIWQSNVRVGVYKGGFSLLSGYESLHRVYRLTNLEERWSK